MTSRGGSQTNALRRCPYIGPYFKIPTLDTPRSRLGGNSHIPNLRLQPLTSYYSVAELESEFIEYSCTGRCYFTVLSIWIYEK